MDCLSIELIHYILYENLDYESILKCLKTSKIFNNILNKKELNLIKNDRSCIYCIEIGDLYNFQQYIKKINNKKINNEYCTYLFETSCRYGRLKIAKWLIEYVNFIGKKIYNSANVISFENLFIVNVSSGHLKMAKWIFEYANNVTEYNKIYIQNVFRIMCKWQYREVLTSVKWIIEYADSIGSPINIRCLSDAFICSCESGNFELAQWLIYYIDSIESSNDNHIDYNKAFEILYSKQNFKMIKWLIENAKSIGSSIDYQHIINDCFHYCNGNIKDIKFYERLIKLI